MTDELAALDATAQADLVRAKELTPRELVEAAILRIEKLDGELNAVIHRRFDRALAEAESPDLPDGPFKGVPFLVKDLGASEKGEPFHWGMRALKEAGHTATADSYLVERFRAAGFVSVGRTNTPELGLVPTTEPEAYGATRNPWDTSRSPGGSSGGAAAAVAAGLVPAAHASDGGGSIRIPASICGLVGLKTSRGRITLGPMRAESSLSVELVHTTSVRDTAAILDAVHGPAAGDNVVAPPPTRRYADEVGADPGALRIGVLAASPRGDLHPECAAAVRATAALLEHAGHQVEEAHPAALYEQETAQQFTVLWATGARQGVTGAGQLIGRELGEADVEPLTWALASMAGAFSALDYANALQAALLYSRRMASWWAGGFDLLVTPTIADLPPELGDLTPDPASPLGAFAKAGALVPFTPPFNMTGQPAINLPLHQSAEGLPVGVQLVAAYGREDLLLRVAAQLEAAAPWAGRIPAVHAQ